MDILFIGNIYQSRTSPKNYKPSLASSTRIEQTEDDSDGLGLESREDETLIREEPISGDRCEWIRYCKKCNNYKPPRSHHCKICQQCVLQMDHHCPWTLNCVEIIIYLIS